MTPYQDINEILQCIENGIAEILKTNLLGLYLCGSLSYGDFNPDSSDIDLVAITKTPLDNNAIELLKQFHQKFGSEYPKWQERIECSYTPIDLFKNKLPPSESRPYFGGGIFYAEAPYGHEWIINNYLLYQHGIALYGRDIKELIELVDIKEVQKACIRDLFQEWEPKINDLGWLQNSHYQSYLVLNLCRILYTVFNASTGSKKVSANWVKKQYGTQWLDLVVMAENWEYGKEMNLTNETVQFIQFAIEKIKSSPCYLDAILEDLKDREPIFHHPEKFGRTKQAIESQMCDEFWEIGASGKIYTKQFVIDTLLKRHGDASYQENWEISDFQLTPIAQDNYLLNYVLIQDKTRITRRSTIWRKDQGQWKILFHQGTIIDSN